jgi:hypothetical protein
MQLPTKTPQFVFFANMPHVKEPYKRYLKTKFMIIGTFQEYQSIFILEKIVDKTNIYQTHNLCNIIFARVFLFLRFDYFGFIMDCFGYICTVFVPQKNMAIKAALQKDLSQVNDKVYI